MDYTSVKFSRPQSPNFSQEVKKRVRAYFKEKGIDRHANATMVIKTIAMISIYFVPYFIALSGIFISPWAYVILYAIMGIGMAGIGLSVMHDANHGAYSRNPKVNKMMGLMLDVVGGNAENWKIQHNQLHHTFTNIEGLDEDISPAGLLRFSPHAKRLNMHKYQHIYAWLLYGLMTFMWIVTKDYKQLARYRDKKLLASTGKTYNRLLSEMLIKKVIYYGYAIVIPILLLPIHWGLVLGLFFMMHFIAGFILGCVFQPAHVMEVCEYPLPSEEGMMENEWTVHQMHTTTNFAPKNRILSWYVGGLNFQVEHHLFPNICHVHYPAISKIVKQTAEEFNVPYYSKPTFMEALWDHGKMLKELGKAA